MDEIAQNCVCNAQKSLAVGALPQIALGGAYKAPQSP